MSAFFGMIWSKWKWPIMVGAASGLLLLALWGYWSWSQGKIDDLTRENATLRVEADSLRVTLGNLRADAERMAALNDQLNKELTKIRIEAQRARRRAAQAAQNAASQPRQVEQQINRETDDAFRGLEALTRVP